MHEKVPYPLDSAPLVAHKDRLSDAVDYQSPHKMIWGTILEDTFRVHIASEATPIRPTREALQLLISQKDDIIDFIDHLEHDSVFEDVESVTTITDYPTARTAIQYLGFRVDRHSGDTRPQAEILAEAQSRYEARAQHEFEPNDADLAILIKKDVLIKSKERIVALADRLGPQHS